MTYGTLLDNRVIGSSGVAIGTHLVLESLFSDTLELYDQERKFDKVKIDDYKYHIYNIYTIARNLVNSCASNDKTSILLDKNFSKLLLDEITMLFLMYRTYKCQPLLFYPDYSLIYKGYNKGKDGKLSVVYEEHILTKNILEAINKKTKLDSVNNHKGYLIPKLDGKVLITTNLPVDLFNKGDISLLESHTGKLKTRFEFNTKYHKLGKLDLSYLPYLEDLMYLLGDKVIVLSSSIGIRKKVLDIGKAKNWTVRTTRDKVRDDLKSDHEVYSLLKQFKPMYGSL